MVHIPLLLFSVDVPEPRLGIILPNVFAYMMRALSRLLDASQDFINPLTPDAEEIYVEALVKAIPPEFHKTMQRIENGDILDSDQLSSEVDEASFDFYRRGIRMAMTGLQGEELKDRSMRRLRLGMGQVSPLAEVWQQHHHEQLMESTLGAARQRRHDGTSSSEQPDLPILDIEQLLVESNRRKLFAEILEDEEDAAAEKDAKLVGSIFSGRKQAVFATTNATIAAAVSVAAAKGVALMVARLLNRRRERKVKAAKAAKAALALAELGRPLTSATSGNAPSVPATATQADAARRKRSGAGRTR